jgi:hypothetical protein
MSTGEHVIGFALDVSGSMEASIRNVSGGKESRLDSIRRALDTLLAEAERLTAVRSGDQPEAELYFFAYAFGLCMPSEFGDLFRLLDCKDDLELLSSRGEHKIPIIYQDIVDRKAAELLASYEHRLKFDERGVAIEVMGSSAYSLLSMSRNEAELKLRRALEQHIRPQVATAVTAEVLKKDLTIPLSELTNRWMNLRDAVSMSNDVLGGQTPMAATLQEVAERFKARTPRSRQRGLYFVHHLRWRGHRCRSTSTSQDDSGSRSQDRLLLRFESEHCRTQALVCETRPCLAERSAGDVRYSIYTSGSWTRS